jgi:hypothetical protein
MAKLSHPNVVAVFDVGRVGDQLFLAMELIDGVTLTRWIADRPGTRTEVLDIFAQAGRGLAAAHQVRLVHRDFKPDNVLVGADGRARVTDFGLTQPVATDPRSELVALDLTAAATALGVLVGTPAYMAPEQLCGEPATARSDQFAFCVALYEALFGARPFAGGALRVLTENVLAGRMRAMPAGTPRWLRLALARGLAVDPAARFPSMTALLDELGRDHGRARRLAVSLGAMAAGAAAIVAVLQFVTKAVSEPSPAGSPVAVTRSTDAPTSETTPSRTPVAATAEGTDTVRAQAPGATEARAPAATAAAPVSGATETPAPPVTTEAPVPGTTSSSAAPQHPTPRPARPAARRFPRAAAIGSINFACRIPYDAAHPDPALSEPILDWGKVTRIDHVPAISDEYPPLEAFEIQGQRATYRTVNDFGPLGTLERVRVGDLLALCSQGEDNLHHMASGPMIVTFLIVPLSAPPRLHEIARFEPRHLGTEDVAGMAEHGKLQVGRYLVYATIGDADGARFSVARGDWQIEIAPDAPGADRIASGKQMWLVIGDPAPVPQGESASRARVVLRVYAALDELFP